MKIWPFQESFIQRKCVKAYSEKTFRMNKIAVKIVKQIKKAFQSSLKKTKIPMKFIAFESGTTGHKTIKELRKNKTMKLDIAASCEKIAFDFLVKTNALAILWVNKFSSECWAGKGTNSIRRQLNKNFFEQCERHGESEIFNTETLLRVTKIFTFEHWTSNKN